MKTKHIFLTIIAFLAYWHINAQTRTLNTSLPVGTTAGNAAVSQSGAATYSIPIFVSPGTNGMQPNLSINYNSQAGDGLLGKGWSLTGISAITRMPSNHYYDGIVDAVNFSSNDRFALDGQRLVSTNGNYGADGTEYQTIQENFAKVYSYGTSGNGPMWFKAVAKDGTVMEFGNTTDSRHQADGTSNVLTWYINKITDLRGNYITFSYMVTSTERYISKIEYTGNTSTGLNPYNSVNFSYQNRNYSQTSYVGGSYINNYAIISKIKVMNESSLIREYNFNYTTSGETRLREVIEKDKNGIQYNSTVIDWGASTPAFTQTSSFNNNQDNYIFYGDYNGDGRTDLFVVQKKSTYTTSDQWKLYTANEDGINFTLRSSGNLPDKFQPGLTKVGDVNGDGMDDILICNFASTLGYYTPYISSGINFTIKNNDRITSSYQYNSICMSDFDNNGLNDILLKSISNKWYLFSYSYSSGNLVSFNGVPKDSGQISVLGGFNNYADFNGDGKTDLMFYRNDSIKICAYVNSELEIISKYANFSFSNRDFNGDFNGDGKTDLLYFSLTDNTWSIALSSGLEYIVSRLKTTPPPLANVDPESDASDNNIFIRDFNGDGKDDVMEVYKNFVNGTATSSTCNIFYSNGDGTFAQETNVFSTTEINTENYAFGDFNGDGKQEIFYRQNASSPYTIIALHKNETNHLISTITNGLNHVTQFTYKTLSSGGSTYSKGSGTTFPVFDFQGPLYVVDNIAVQNGLGATNTTYYQYTGAKIHRQGKGFLGFSKVTSYSNVTGLKQENSYAFDNVYYHTYLKQSINSTIGTYGQSISTTNHLTGFHHYGNKRYFPYDSIVNSYNVQTGVSTTSTATFDTNGNLKSTFVNSNGLATKTTVYIGYNNLGQPGSVTTTSTRTGETNYVAKDSFQYYSNGLLKLQITEPGNAKQVNTGYTYNAFGNVTQVTTTSNGLKRRVAFYEYDTKSRMRTKTRNSAGHFTKDSCNYALGVVLQSRDHNNLVTTYGYDGFGRLTQTTAPDGITSTVAYNWSSGTVPYSLYSVTTSTPGAPASVKYFDKLGREVGAETNGISGTKVRTQTRYNAKGQVSFVTSPYYSPGISYDTTLYTYDFLGRVKTLIGPNTNTTYDYFGLKTSVTDNFRKVTTTSEADATGLTKKSTDASGRNVEYTYNAMGQARQVSALGNYITMGYDQFGRQTLLRDPNAASNKYDYNNYGELTSQRDTLNRTTSVGYDSLGRVTTKTSPDYSFTYYYNNSGITDSIRSANVSTIFAYDTNKRLKSKTDRVNGVALKSEFEYDTYGRISKKIFPSNFAVTYLYKNGHLEEIKRADNGASIWKVNTTNERGQVIRCTYGNGISTDMNYDYSGAVNSIITSTSPALYGNIQALQYSYNKSGQMNYRLDYRNGRSLREDFTYDADNRLDSIKINGALANNMVYKTNGAISYKNDVGNYTYNSETSQIVKQTEYRGMLKPQQQSITYTSFNKTATITEGSKTCSFTYGTDMERSYMETNIFGTITKKYYTDSYERTVTGSTTRQLNYIFAAGQLVAIFVKNGTTDSMYYVHTDHLGSLNVITNASGAIVSEMSFDAWGNRRDPATWKNLKTTPAGLITSRGFTGHEHLDAYGLINMNGRVYDPVLASFLSPDNYVQAPDYSQSFNRYAYCFNNPLKFTDPTGMYVDIYSLPGVREAANNHYLRMAATLPGGGGWAQHFAWKDRISYEMTRDYYKSVSDWLKYNRHDYVDPGRGWHPFSGEGWSRLGTIAKGIAGVASFFPFESFFAETKAISYVFRGEDGQRNLMSTFKGIKSWGDNEDLIAHTLNSPRDVKSAYIPTSTSEAIAKEFGNGGYVLTIRNRNGIDVNSFFRSKGLTNYYGYESEIAMPYSINSYDILGGRMVGNDGNYIGSFIYNPNYIAPSISIPSYTLPTITMPMYTMPTYTTPSYTMPSFTVPGYTIPTFTFPTIIFPY
jgi:RHS repeat-associated protein